MPTNVTISGALYRNTSGELDSAYVPMPRELAYAVGHYTSEVMPFTLVRPAPLVMGAYSADWYAHPDQPKEIPIVAQGGAFPHSVVIDAAPDGATISNTPWDVDNYLVLRFTAPSVEGVYPIRLRLYDAVGQLININYTLTVSKSAFVVISPLGDDTTGNGTKETPWKTRTKAWASTTGGKILLLEDGVYTETSMGHYFTSSSINSMLSWNPRGATIDLIDATPTSGVPFITNNNHISIQGIEFKNPLTTTPNSRWFSCDSSSRYLNMDNCVFTVDGRSGTLDNDNTVCWMLGGDIYTDRRYVSQTRCKFTGFVGLANGWAAIDLYATRYCVVRGNVFDDQRSSTTSAGIIWVKGLKNNSIDIMLNEFKMTFGGAIVDIAMGNATYEDNVTGNIHAAFNLIRCNPGTGIWISRSDNAGARLPVWTSRNTVVGGSIRIVDRDFVMELHSDGDVIQSTDGSTDPWKIWLSKNEQQKPLSDMPKLIYSVVNYECQADSGVVDSDGILIGEYAQYRGTRGHEITRGI